MTESSSKIYESGSPRLKTNHMISSHFLEKINIMQSLHKKTSRNNEIITKRKLKAVDPKNYPHYQIQRLILSIERGLMFYGMQKIYLEAKRFFYKRLILENIGDRMRREFIITTGRVLNIWRKITKIPTRLKLQLRSAAREIFFFIHEKIKKNKKIAFQLILSNGIQEIVQIEKLNKRKNFIVQGMYILNKIWIRKEIIYMTDVLRILEKRMEIVEVLKGLFFVERTLKKKYFMIFTWKLKPRIHMAKILSLLFKKLKILIRINEASAFYKMVDFFR
jgi:hypothetical protein